MKIDQLIERAKNSVGAEIVYTAPYEKGDVTVIAAASVASGAGGGDGVDKQGQHGEGGGFGMAARPTGAYVIKDGKVRWEPAVDVNRLLTVVGAVVGAALFFAARIVKIRSKAPATPAGPPWARAVISSRRRS
ncbi:spore germination protein GerW family protein [Amycolatopsis thermophila]|uniref:Spore protein YtfJ n=1 Tax=Amycolatopsis thermophila TaxID=206084 RepID=A0ABU0F0I1_9PSEU|nr:spore germination protein GerW family protein [Amycolatopsis thermophila]MDQ0381075.1 putative spore protein YtfJ [Amycolatopsis thermophila]